MEAQEITDFNGQKQFLAVANILYRGDPNWIAPLEGEVLHLLNQEQNKWLAKGSVKLWVLKDAEKGLIGRVAAFYSGRDKLGRIGFFECIHNQDAANLLFDTAVTWLQEQGLDLIEAPVQPGSREAYWGLLIDGFSRPAFQDVYNPPYYQSLFEAYGFRKDYDQETALIRAEWFKAERLSVIADHAIAKHHYRSVGFTWKNRAKLAKDLCRVYNLAWQVHEHFQELGEAEVLELMQAMKPLMVPELIRMAYQGDEPIGFFVSLRDLNQYLRGMKGKQGLWFKLRLAMKLKFGVNRRMRAILFGVVPEHQNRGVESVMIYDYFRAAQKMKGLDELELSWVGDFNPRMLRLLEGIGARPYKRHRTFSLRIRT
ncbi:MAG: GNAT family N-acetyltransferase [Bacteroidetes bacterium]|nr:MAG: GNAT family N-acetyltransferase [Bacteroidota bacterium]